jgi:putative transcriptional regulator
LTLLSAPGQLTSEIELARGRFLVASNRLDDPGFRETVVLLMRYGLEGAAGLVINRPLEVKLATVLPDFKDSAHRDKALYLGGPVEPTKMLLLEKSAKPPPDSMPVFGDVYISSSRAELQRLMKSTDKDDKFKIFAGYAGWAPGQLEAERDRGDWHVLKADAATVFDKKSSEIWPELIHRFRANWVYLKSENGQEFRK